VVIGSGPAGYTAAIYLARANLTPLVFEGATAAGGALMDTTEVENFPGFPDGVTGPGLMESLRKQAERFGADIVSENVTEVDLTVDPKVVKIGSQTVLARSVVLATGSAYRELGVPGEKSLSGHGVSWCATCDGPFFNRQDVMVVGGGDSALEEALFLTRFARKVHVVHRRDSLRASKIMQQRAFDSSLIEFIWDTEVVEAIGEEKLSGVRLRDLPTGETRVLEVDGLFIAVGHDPRSELVRGQVDLDANGYVLVRAGSTQTNLPGVFAAGDLVDHSYRQAVTAAGTGCMAALDAERFLSGVEASQVTPLADDAVAARPPAQAVVTEARPAATDEITKDAVMALETTDVPVEGDDIESLWEGMLEKGWSDGLPVIPPTPARVQQMLAGRDPAAVHVALGSEATEATMVRIAANAVMAGCHPSYFPAVLAALEGVVAATAPPPYGSPGGQIFLGAPTPLLVFNGPIRQELGINCSHDMLSLADRANATIGRAVRLVLRNITGAVAGTLFDVQHGMPGRASMVFGEAEEESPWEPFAPNGSAVSVFAATGSMPLNYHQVPQRADELLLIIKKCLDYVRGNRIGPWPDTSALLVLSPKHARGLAAEGWTKQQVEDELTAAVNDHYDYNLLSNIEKLELINRNTDPGAPPLTIPMPEDPVRVLVAGGVAGWHSLIIPTRSFTPPATVPIRS